MTKCKMLTSVLESPDRDKGEDCDGALWDTADNEGSQDDQSENEWEDVRHPKKQNKKEKEKGKGKGKSAAGGTREDQYKRGVTFPARPGAGLKVKYTVKTKNPLKSDASAFDQERGSSASTDGTYQFTQRDDDFSQQSLAAITEKLVEYSAAKDSEPNGNLWDIKPAAGDDPRGPKGTGNSKQTPTPPREATQKTNADEGYPPVPILPEAYGKMATKRYNGSKVSNWKILQQNGKATGPTGYCANCHVVFKAEEVKMMSEKTRFRAWHPGCVDAIIPPWKELPGWDEITVEAKIALQKHEERCKPSQEQLQQRQKAQQQQRRQQQRQQQAAAAADKADAVDAAMEEQDAADAAMEEQDKASAVGTAGTKQGSQREEAGPVVNIRDLEDVEVEEEMKPDEPGLDDPTNVKRIEWWGTCSWEEIIIIDPSTAAFVPQSISHAITEVKAKICRNIEEAARNNDMDKQDNLWKCLWAIDPILMAAPSTRAPKTQQDRVTWTQKISEKLSLIEQGQWGALWAAVESRNNDEGKGKVNDGRSGISKTVKRMEELIQAGETSKAAAAVWTIDQGKADRKKVVEKFKSTQQEDASARRIRRRLNEGTSNLQQATSNQTTTPYALDEGHRFSEEDKDKLVEFIIKGFRKFPKRSGAGPGGGRFEHWQCVGQNEDAAKDIAKTLLRLITGEMPKQALSAYLAARLVGIPKSNGGGSCSRVR